MDDNHQPSAVQSGGGRSPPPAAVVLTFRGQDVENRVYNRLPEALRCRLDGHENYRFALQEATSKPRRWVVTVDDGDVPDRVEVLARDAHGPVVELSALPAGPASGPDCRFSMRADSSAQPLKRHRWRELLAACKSVGHRPGFNGTWWPQDKPGPAREFWWGDELAAETEGWAGEWLWEGLIPHGQVTLLSALWKAGKTTLLSHLFRVMGQLGTEDQPRPPFLGARVRGPYPEMDDECPTKVLVVTEESRRDWRRRGADDHVAIWSRPFGPRTPTFKEWGAFVERVTRHCREHFYLAVIDTLSGLWPVRDENDAGQVARALAPLRRVTATGAGVLLVHHDNKSVGPRAPVGSAARGSGALPGSVDAILELGRGPGLDPSDRRRVIRASGRHPDTMAGELWFELTTGGELRTACPPVGGGMVDGDTSGLTAAVLGVLPEAPPGLTGDEVLALIPAGTAASEVKAELRRGAEAGAWTRTGAGRKGNPYRFHRGDGIAAERTVGPRTGDPASRAV